MFGCPPRRLQLGQFVPCLGAKAFHQVFDDGARFGYHGIVIGHHGRLAQGVDLLERRRCQSAHRVAPVEADVIGNGQLFEQPEDALRARRFKVMDGKHGAPWWLK